MRPWVWLGVAAMIDWKRVEELREEIGTDGFVEVADMFLDEAEGAVRALISGLPDNEVEGQLHFLKGSALNLGLSELASICQEGERKAAVGFLAGYLRTGQVRPRSGTRTGLRHW
jgi:histidine phosphotransfer protein HptB